MRFQNNKSNRFCVGQKQYCGTKNVVGETKSNKKFRERLSYFLVHYQYAREKKPMTVSDNTVEAESLSDFFKNLGKKRRNVSKKMAKTC